MARLLVQAGTWAVTFLVARLLEPTDYGVMTWGTVFLGLAEILAEAGIGRALVHKEDLAEDDPARAFTLCLILSAALYLLLLVGAALAERWLNVPGLASLLIVLGLVLWLSPIRSVALALLDREQKILSQAAILVLASAAQSALVLALAWNGAGYWALAAGAIAAKLTEALTLGVACGWWPRLAWPGSEAWGLARYGLYISGASLLWYFYSNADFAVVGKMFGEKGLGFYALAFQLMSIPVQRLTGGVNQVAFPVFCRLQRDPARLRSWYLRLTVLLGAFGLPALAGLALTASDAFLLLLGEKWLPAVPLFQLLSIAGAVQIFGHSLPPLFNALGRPDLNFRYTFACAVLFPPAFILGGWLGGVEGVCLSWLVIYPLLVGALIALTSGVTGISLADYLRPQGPVLAALVVMSGVVLAIQALVAPPLPRLVASVAGGAATYAGSLCLLGRRTVVADTLALLRELRGRRDG
jgi:O-antigen/teichoic acid export membrane protein